MIREWETAHKETVTPNSVSYTHLSAAKYYIEDDMPVKLCYLGNTFINSSDYQGRLKESTQLSLIHI